MATDGFIACCTCVFAFFQDTPKSSSWWSDLTLTTMMMILGCPSYPSLLKWHCHDGASLLFSPAAPCLLCFAPPLHSHCSHPTSRLDFGLFFVESSFHFLVFCACAMADSLCSSHEATTNPALFSFHFWQCRPFFFVHLILTGLLVVSLLFTLVIHNKS